MSVVTADALAPCPPLLDPGPPYHATGRQFQGIPGLERAPGGRLWATWYSGGDNEGPENYVLLVSSADDGQSWSEPLLVIDPPGDVRAFDPCLWLDPTGRLWLFWAQSHSWFDGRAGVWAISTAEPDSERPRWSAPQRLADGIMMNKPTVTAAGAWLYPIAAWRVAPNSREERRFDLGAQRGANVFRAADQGRRLELLGQAQVERPLFDEHMVIERGDGALVMLIRTADGLAESVSADGGATWSASRAVHPDHPSSRFFLRRLRSGRLLLVKHSAPGGPARSHLTAWLSEDDGQSWQGGLLLDARGAVSYPDGAEAPDGSIYVIYDRERQAAREILLAVFSEAEVLAGTGGRLRQVVSRGGPAR